MIFQTRNGHDSMLKNHEVDKKPLFSIDDDKLNGRSKDSRSTKVIIKGGLSNSSSTNNELVSRQLNDIGDHRNYMKSTQSRLKLNYLNDIIKETRKPQESTVTPRYQNLIDHEYQNLPMRSAGITMNPQKITSDLIPPKMMRTSHNNRGSNIDTKTNRIQSKHMADIPESRRKQSVNCRNQHHRKVSNTSAKRSNSRGSRIEGKLNEKEMLPIAQDLNDEELEKYKI